MKTRLLGLLAATALTTAGLSAASAADLPSRVAPAPVFAPAPIFTWSGFYAGVNAGWGWRDDDEETVVLTGPGVPAGLVGTLEFDDDNGGFTGGGPIGYKFQIRSVVIGAPGENPWG